MFFSGSGLGHVGQIVDTGLVHSQAFFSQIKTREETSVNDGQASVRLCLETTDQLVWEVKVSPKYKCVFFILHVEF